MPRVTSASGRAVSASKAVTNPAANRSTGRITWSALTTASSASGSTSATRAAARPTAFAVSRATGSSTSRPGLSAGSAARIWSAYRAAVHTQMLSAGSTDPSRSNASASRLCAPPPGSATTSSSCLGRPARDNGHSRVPDPPAMITAWRMSAPSTHPAPPASAGGGELAGPALEPGPGGDPAADVGHGHPGSQARPQREPQRGVPPSRKLPGQVAQRAGVVDPLHAVRITARGVATLVDDDRRWRVDVQVSRSAQSLGEIDVLEVHEVARVEPSHRPEGGDVHEEAGAGEPTRRALARRLPLAPIPSGPRVARPHPPEQRVPHAGGQSGEIARRRVELALRGPDRRSDRGRSGPPGGHGQELVDRARLELHVGVGYQGVPVGETGETSVDGSAVADVAPGAHEPDVLTARGQGLRHTVGGAVV